jgi:hypothetical protein
MPFQRLFTRHDQKIVPNLNAEETVTAIGAFLRQAQFQQSYPGPFQIHAEQFYSRIGLRRVIDIWVNNSAQGAVVTLEISATLGDAEAAVGLVGAVLLLPVAVAVGAVSYLDYEADATNLLASLWSYLGTMKGVLNTPIPPTMRCGNCGLEIGNEDRFCKRCGAKVKP